MSIVVRSVSDQLVELVRDRILSGEIPADQSIRQDAIAASFGVSKVPLREALTRLEQEGLVRSHANRGFFVSALDAQEAEEVFALRLKLEPEAAAVAAAMATPEDQKAAQESLKALNRAIAGRAKSVGGLNRTFHLALIRPSRQAITTTILERLHAQSERYVRKHLEPAGRIERANQEHDRLLQAWIERDGAALSSLMHAHIAETLEDLRDAISPAREPGALTP